MATFRSVMIGGAVIVLFSGFMLAAAVWADDHDEERYGRTRHRERGHAARNLAPVPNATYAESCGACHPAYQPELLPAGSWRAIMDTLETHFGQAVDLDAAIRKEMTTYLLSNAADTLRTRLAQRILKSLNGETPLRITQVPYIQRKHHDIAPRVFENAAIGSLANCAACHRSAQAGIYNDDDVLIPQ